ncbi:MAG: hypothetical protein SFZ02_21305 [bacterium]|nr:hypothetical protein [bacterium]
MVKCTRCHAPMIHPFDFIKDVIDTNHPVCVECASRSFSKALALPEQYVARSQNPDVEQTIRLLFARWDAKTREDLLEEWRKHI